MNIKNIEGKIYAYGLDNALSHKGKAIPGSVLSHLFREGLERNDVKEVMPLINSIIKKVNSMNDSEQENELKKLGISLKKFEHKEKELPAFTNTKNVIMRFEPSPSGALHIGHAYILSLNSEYVKKYKGKLILRIADTNPDNIYVSAYDMIPESAQWLTGNAISKTIIQSDRMKMYYDYFKKLLDMGKAYICTCDLDSYKKLITESKPCPCRGLSVSEQNKRWEKMLKTYSQGEAVARIKTELKDKNPAMRDFPVFRINETKHVKKGTRYRVWPLMNMAVTVDDIEEKVTHIIRAKDHADNAKRQRFIYKYLKKPFPEAIFVGKINFKGMPLSTTETIKDIKKGKYSGWDDVRLPFLPALRKRGYQPNALIQYSLDIGISLTDKTVEKEEFFKALNAHNREIIDKHANRYFFVADPKKIVIKNAPKKNITIPLHPDVSSRGKRLLKTNDKFYVADKIKKDELYRFMNLFTFKNKEFISEEESQKAQPIHWLPVSKELVKVKVFMDDGSIVKGLGESSLKKIKTGEIIQFVRFGFCRFNKKNKGVYEFWFTHK